MVTIKTNPHCTPLFLLTVGNTEVTILEKAG
jgi:hypothetical protein